MEFVTLYKYNQKFIYPVIRSLNQIDWNRALTEDICGWGSLRNLIVHTFEAEDFWFTKVLQGNEFKSYDDNDYRDIQSIEKKWNEVTERSLNYIKSLSEADLQSIRKVKFEEEMSFKVEDVLIHVYTHMAHHRGQMVMAVRQMGGKPECVDIL